MKVGFISLGCPKNLVDSEVMMGQLVARGHELTPHPDQADVLVVNTCSFIDPAKKESVDTILEMAEYKRIGRAKKLIVAGCLVERYRGDIRTEMPEVDALVGTNELASIVALCEGTEVESNPLEPYLYHDLTPRVLSTPRHFAYIKIAEGCDHPCMTPLAQSALQRSTCGLVCAASEFPLASPIGRAWPRPTVCYPESIIPHRIYS